MKQTTTYIKKILENENLDTQLENLKDSNPTYTNQETSILEVYEGMNEIKNLLFDSIENGNFEKLPFVQRNSIYTRLQNVQKYVSHINQVIPQYNALVNTIHTSKLFEMTSKNIDFEEKTKEINSLRTKYRKLLKDLEDLQDIRESVYKVKNEVDENSKNISDVSKKADSLKSKYEKDEIEIDSKTKSISESEQEIENKKKKILAFESNIKDNEEKLKFIYDKLNEEINEKLETKIKTADDLIIEAENALQLKQTEGIAAAYSSRLKKISESNNKKYWLIGALSFVILTLFFGYLLTGGQINLHIIKFGFKETDNIGFIIGRIALTAIGISGAVFCAKRFVLLRNLEEDYEYKVVLTKSILAFANKIKDLNDDKVAEYLTQVLNELHQDPLRTSKEKSVDNGLISILNVEKIAEILKKSDSK